MEELVVKDSISLELFLLTFFSLVNSILNRFNFHSQLYGTIMSLSW